MDLDCYDASGCRRAFAAAAIATALNGAELVAVVVAPEHQAAVAGAIQGELVGLSGLRVLRALGSDFPTAASGPSAQRAVLLWEGIDPLLSEPEDRFNLLVTLLGAALARRCAEASGPLVVHRAVLIGGSALMGRLERLAPSLPETVRCRYVLVQ
jgi:hypothetical protein